MWIRTAAALAGALVLAMPLAAQAEDPARGKVLYETLCTECHSKSVHNRASRKAKDFPAVRAEVSRWNKQLGGAWRAEEIDDVSVYLNDLYYKFPCPQTVCRNAQRPAGSASRG